MSGCSSPSSQVTSDSQDHEAPSHQLWHQVRGLKRPASQAFPKQRPRAAAAKAKASEDDSGSCQVTSESSETKRINEAERTWQTQQTRPRAKPKAKPQACNSSDDSESSFATSDSGNAPGPADTQHPKPKSSGMLDFCQWMVEQLTPEERQQAAARWFRTFGEFCAGMGTGLMCCEGLRRAMATHDFEVDAKCTCFTEKVPWKAKALSDLSGCLKSQEQSPATFKLTGDLNEKCGLKDIHGNTISSKPTFELLMQGLVCVDISGLTSTPKSISDAEGSSGRSLHELLKYLESLSFKDRPDCIILECVRKLMHLRKKGLPKPEIGTQVVSQALRGHGYVGSWQAEDAKDFYLPASRRRVWGLFLKVKLRGPNPMDAEQKRWDDVSRAISIVKRLRILQHEPLPIVLDRLGSSQSLKSAAPTKPTKHAKSLNLLNLNSAHSRTAQKVMKLLHLEPEDLQSRDLQEFLATSAGILNQSSQLHVLMRMASLKKKGKVPDWRKEILAFNADESGYRLGVGITRFPCVLPTKNHIIALHGSLVKADGLTCLAMQGIQPKELEAFAPISKQTSKRQQDWGGNAFTANTCAAYILAAAVVR